MNSDFLSRLIRTLAAACMLTALAGGHATVHADGPQVTHHLHVILDPANQRLLGRDILQMPSYDGLRMVFHLSPTARVTSVRVLDDPAPARLTDGQLEISLPDPPSSRPLTVTIDYEADFCEKVSQSPLNTEDPTYGVTGSMTSEGVFLLADAGWYPDLPGYDARFQVEIETPEPFHAVTAGRKVGQRVESGKRIATWLIEHPVRGLALSAGPYVVQSLEKGDFPISTYFLPATAPLVETYLEAAQHYLELYSELFGPYPFPKFAIVENFFPTGYGFPSYTLLGSTVIRLPFITRTSLGHEVAHSWWGNSVFVDASRGNWSEGLATYVADHFYKERESSDEGRRYRMQILRNYANLVPEKDDFPLGEFLGRTSPASRTIGYGKGAMLFHMVRCLAGEEAFWGGLRDVYQAKRFREASWPDFAEAFGKRCKRDLGSFFSQWVERPGAPTISLEDLSVRQEGNRWEVRGTLHQAPPFYDLMVPLRVENQSGGMTHMTVHLKERAAPFTVECKSAPAALTVDPEINLFRRLYPSEIPADINMLRASRSLALILSRGAPKELREAATMLLVGLGRPEALIIEEDSFSGSQHKEHDLLFVGIPENHDLFPQLPTGLSVHRGSFQWDGRHFAKPSDALFAVLPSTRGSARVEALFLPLSSGAANLVARKIPHYGTYSLLVFEDGANAMKQTWPTLDSPLIHRFPLASSP
jgi:hypothetical protein